IWPFAVSIIGFSLFIDRIGYKVSMIFAFAGHIIWAIMGFMAWKIGAAEGATDADKATAYQLVYWGSLILALGNGTVEAFINPVVATMFNKDKVKWLNILHAGWPGGLVLAGIIIIFMGDLAWGYKVGMIALPAVIYLLMLLPCKFPVSERVASGVSYKEMLSEFGVLGAAIVGFLVTLQLMDFASQGGAELTSGQVYGYIAVGVAIVVAFGVYTQSLGRPLMFVLVLIMMPLATTEIGTDGWITGVMEGVVKGGAEDGSNLFHPGWVLVYTSIIMAVLRFFAGPISHKLSALGLLAASSVLAIIGLYTLGGAEGIAAIFIAATVYAFGKTFFWPTMLGVVSEQMPKGGALSLNAISGIGMLAVGTLGFPYIGALQAEKAIAAVEANEAAQTAGLVKDGKISSEALSEKAIYEIIKYQALNGDAAAMGVADKDAAKKIDEDVGKSGQGALGNMIVFPGIMLVAYLLLMGYFKQGGGYQAVELDDGGGGGGDDAGGDDDAATAEADDGGGGDESSEG
ncbi:MAG: hypothetical protein VX254_02890, partial [Planctomycetota bacterium]|nr:hypothetical protein [Planctomycetota bacterium]